MEYTCLQNMDLNEIKMAFGGCLNGAQICKLPLHVVQNNRGNTDTALFQIITTKPNQLKKETSQIATKPLLLPNVCKRQLDFDGRDVENNLNNNNNDNNGKLITSNNNHYSPSKIVKRLTNCQTSSRSKSKAVNHDSHKYTKPQTASVVRRNQRERNRVRLINSTFGTLRDHIPGYALPEKQTKKMSKADILKSAIDYINDLQQLITDYDTPGAHDSLPFVTSQSSSDILSAMGSLDSPSSGTLSDCPSPIEDDVDNEFLDLVNYWLQ